MLNQQPDIDTTPVFEQLWELSNQLRRKLDARFELHPNESTQDLQQYSSINGSAQGSLNTFSGSEIDWLVHGRLRDAQTGFSNMHLTVWLGSQIRVPHLAFAFGTMPFLFFYMDYIPRSDLLVDLNYLDRYYEPVNQTFLTLQSDSRFKPFVSKTLYMRQAQSHTSLCYTCPTTDETLALVSTVSHEMIDRWLIWVDQAEPVPDTDWAALAQRDLTIRRTIAERDPDNAIALRLFGAEMTDKLVRALWGG